MTLSPEQGAIIALVAINVILFVCVWFRRDTDQENRRRGYIALSKALDEVGLSRLSDAAESLAVDDKSGLAREGLALAKELSNPEKMMALLAESFYKQLPNRLKRPEDRVKIFQAVSEAKQTLSKPAPMVD